MPDKADPLSWPATENVESALRVVEGLISSPEEFFENIAWRLQGLRDLLSKTQNLLQEDESKTHLTQERIRLLTAQIEDLLTSDATKRDNAEWQKHKKYLDGLLTDLQETVVILNDQRVRLDKDVRRLLERLVSESDLVGKYRGQAGKDAWWKVFETIWGKLGENLLGKFTFGITSDLKDVADLVETLRDLKNWQGKFPEPYIALFLLLHLSHSIDVIFPEIEKAYIDIHTRHLSRTEMISSVSENLNLIATRINETAA